QEIAALPESLRNDANWLSVIDTTYNEMVGLKGGGVTRQFMYINNIRFEVEYYADSSPGTEVFDDAQVDP
ncbi:MAG TPA: hypothetical protein VJU16_02340, partial [Planctomycetota bacterium]|nr:hypothetical protein [Planctomycetota bacterium]